MSDDESTTRAGASIVVHRTVAWNETDAAGHNHFSAAFRWMEEAEHALYAGLGLDMAIIDRVPRVHIDIDYAARLYFGEQIAVTVAVTRVGTSSCSLAFAIRKQDGTTAISGTYVIVHAASTTEGSAPWPADIRDALTSDRALTLRSTFE